MTAKQYLSSIMKVRKYSTKGAAVEYTEADALQELIKSHRGLRSRTIERRRLIQSLPAWKIKLFKLLGLNVWTMF